MSISTKYFRSIVCSILVLGGIFVFLPGSGLANVAFQEQWLATPAAAQRPEPCDPGEICLELCLINPQTGLVIKEGVFQCFAEDPNIY